MKIKLPYNLSTSTRPYQKEVLTDQRRNKVLVLHRRAGKTSLAVAHLIMQAILNPKKTFYYICPTQRQAKQIVWTAPNMMSQLIPSDVVAKKNEVDLSLQLKNGSQIHVKGADNPDSLRGIDGYGWILDEYAQMKPELYDQIVMPIIAANGGWVWIIGTPKGKNHFYDRYNIAENHPKQWQTLLLKAGKSNIIPEDALEEARKAMTQASFNQEFNCEFLDDAGSVFRRVKDNATATPREPQLNHEYVLGVDLAKYNDWTVICVMDKFDHHIIHMERFNQIDWQLQKARIEAVARRYNDALVRMDATGIGDPIVEDLQRIGLNIEPFKFTSQSKKDLITNLALKIEQDKIKYLDSETLIDELLSFTYDINERSRTLSYSAPPGKHDDCVIALALSVWNLGEQMKINEKLYDTKIEFEYDEYGSPISPRSNNFPIQY